LDDELTEEEIQLVSHDNFYDHLGLFFYLIEVFLHTYVDLDVSLLILEKPFLVIEQIT